MNNDSSLPAGVYRHYKGHLVYLLGVARHSETEEKLVAYIPLAAKKGPRITVRPYDMFFEHVSVDGKQVPRFEWMGQEVEENVATKYEQTKNWGAPLDK